MSATARDVQRLHGVHPTVVAAITNILQTLPMFVVVGVRTTAQQQALYARGRTVSGAIVTYTDGVIRRSHHQRAVDGFGHAVDMAWIVKPGGDPFNESHPWESYGILVEAAGLVWGGRWKMADRPHAEQPVVA
jgi:peptidoglycan L-alanyl-D-glutamate endopeptidase CwlK